MAEILKTLRVLWLLAFVFLIVLPKITVAQDEIPITTKSEEARKLFLEGLKMFDNIRWDEAREHFSKAIEKDPDFASAYLFRAAIASSVMDYQNYLQKAVALAPKVTEGERLLIEANQIAAENNPLKAIQLMEQLVQKFPNDKRTRWYLGSTYRNRGENDKAIAEFEKAIAIDKDFAPVYNTLGYAYYEKGDYEKSEETFKAYIRLLPAEANPHDSIADLYSKMGRYQDAIDHYKKALDLNPTFSGSHGKIGNNLIFLSKFEEARETFKKAMATEITPAAKIYDQRKIAYSYIYEGKPQQAIVEADKALKMATEANLPEQEAATNQEKCVIYTEIGDLNNAKKSLAECQKVVMGSEFSAAIKDNYSKATLFHEARITAKQKDFDKAMTKADEYKAKIELGKDPKELENYHALVGYIYFNKGDYAKAIEHLNQANQENPYTLYLMAVSESKVGDKEKTAELFKKVANWNQYGLNYGFVRSKAMAAMK